MAYSNEDIKRRLRLGEDSAWEFKQFRFSGDEPKSPRCDDMADEIVAFANARGGTILCGVTDEGEVQGMSRQQLVNLDRMLVEVSSTTIRPPVQIATDHMEFENDKLLLIVDIPQGESLHERGGLSYIRVGSTKRQMASDDRLRLAQRRGQSRIRSFDEQTLSAAEFNAFDTTLWESILSAKGQENPEKSLESITLISEDQNGKKCATIAGILLCTKNPNQWLPHAIIMATHYLGKNRASRQVDAREITGPLNAQIQNAVEFVIKNMLIAARKDPARVDIPQYSSKAVFEGVVNAVAHRDYSMRGSRIRISMFEDRLEIQSPGNLPNNLTLEGMVGRQATRNEVLASVLGRMSVGTIQGSEHRTCFMERRGDGVQIIIDETQKLSGRLPRYEIIDGAEVLLAIPSAPQEPSASRTIITAWANGLPLDGTELLVIFPNRTWELAVTNENGEAIFDLHTTTLPLAVFAAKHGYSAKIIEEWTPKDGSLAVELDCLESGGSKIIPDSTGTIPGIQGNINPVMDRRGRTFLYAAKLSINNGMPQPVSFLSNTELLLTDARGARMLVRIPSVLGRSSLVEYRVSGF